MNKILLKYLGKRPEIYEVTGLKFWDDQHISKGMLTAHLNPELESATRKYDFIEKSVSWIEKLANGGTGKKLLDLGCGPGIYAELFAKKGFDVTGSAVKADAIKEANKYCESKNKTIKILKIIQKDMVPFKSDAQAEIEFTCVLSN